MRAAQPRRRPPLRESLPGFVPSLVLVLATIWIPRPFQPWALILLLLGASLSMAAICHATGLAREPSFTRTALRRGPAHLIVLAVYTAVVLVLVAWPLLVLARTPSLVATLGLAAALAVAAAILWRSWPVFGLVFEWRAAFAARGHHSGTATALARSIRFAMHLTREREAFMDRFLPASLAQLAIVFLALTLAGVGASLPAAIRSLALVVYAVVLLPLCSVIVADRSFRLLREGRPQPGMPSLETPPLHAPEPEPSAAGDAVPAPEAPVLPAAPAPAASPSPQALLDEGLLMAALAGDREAAQAWLARGANPGAVPAADARDQRSALVRAAELPDAQLLRVLIEHGADVNGIHAGLTPLLAATRSCHHGRPGTVTTLVTNGADPGLADVDGNTPLHHAALCAEPAVAAILIDAEAPLEVRNRDQVTALGVAAGAANWPLLGLLIEHGAEPDSGLPMAAGIADDDPEGVRTLLRHKANVNATDALGRSALLYATRETHTAIAQELLKAGADPALADRYGTTPLMEAARAGATGIVKLLVERQPDVHATDGHGRSALLLACQSSRANVDCVRALLALGADPKGKGRDGRNAIDQAAGIGRWDLVALLDPAAPLPASQIGAADGDADSGTESRAHLLDALRFAHWNVVAGFTGRIQGWPQHELAALFLDLADHGDATPRSWLLEHGLDAEATLADGRRLFDAVLEQLPGSCAALRQLLDAGATPAGAGRFARALARLGGSDADPQLALAMLERGADAAGADPHGRTPLHHACRLPRLPLLLELLARGADPNVRDRTGATPLHVAMEGDPGAALTRIRALIARGADPESPAASGETPLGLALARGASELEYWLHWKGWPLPGRPLRPADLPAAAADPDAVSRLLELGMAVDTRDEHGATALLRACGAGTLPSVQHLLAAHADPELVVETGASPLSAAVTASHADCVRALVEAGIAVDRRHPDDITALMIASARGDPGMVKLLRKLGAQTDLTDVRGRTALHAAARFCFDSHDSLRCRRLLDAVLDENPAPDTADKSGATPLLVLLGVDGKPGTECDGTHLGALLPVLLDAGALIEQANENGVSPLHACAVHALFEPARVLLERGADRSARDCMQRTPADVAQVLGYVDLALMLAPRGNGARKGQPTVAASARSTG